MTSPHRVSLFAIATFCCLVAWSPSASAGNALFLQGDAFFATTLDKTLDAALQKGRKLRVRYSLFNRPLMKCGYQGARWLSLKVSPKTQQNLRKVYAILRKQTPAAHLKKHWRHKPFRKRFEGFASFLYTSQFHPRKYQLGIRYNERWHKLMHKKRHQPLLPVGERARKGAERRSRQVRGLRIKISKKNEREGHLKERAVWFVLASPNLQDYYRRKEGTRLYKVSDTVKVFHIHKGRWKLVGPNTKLAPKKVAPRNKIKAQKNL